MLKKINFFHFQFSASQFTWQIWQTNNSIKSNKPNRIMNKAFDVTEARTHGPGRSVPMFKSRVWRPLGYPGAPGLYCYRPNETFFNIVGVVKLILVFGIYINDHFDLKISSRPRTFRCCLIWFTLEVCHGARMSISTRFLTSLKWQTSWASIWSWSPAPSCCWRWCIFTFLSCSSNNDPMEAGQSNQDISIQRAFL